MISQCLGSQLLGTRKEPWGLFAMEGIFFLFRELFWLGPSDMRQMVLNQDWTVELSITYIHQQIDPASQIESKGYYLVL